MQPHPSSRSYSIYARLICCLPELIVGHGRFHYLLLAVCGACLLALVIELLNIGFVAGAVACELGPIGVGQRGALLAAAFLGVVLSSHAWGCAVDRFGRHRALRWSTASAAGCSLLSAVGATNIHALIAGRLATGLCVSGVQSAALVYLGEFHGRRTRAPAVAQASMCMVAALWFMTSLAWLALPSASMSGAQVHVWANGWLVLSAWRLDVCAGAVLLSLLWTVLGWLPESAVYLVAEGRDTEALDALKVAYRWNCGAKVILLIFRYSPITIPSKYPKLGRIPGTRTTTGAAVQPPQHLGANTTDSRAAVAAQHRSHELPLVRAVHDCARPEHVAAVHFHRTARHDHDHSCVHRRLLRKPVPDAAAVSAHRCAIE